MRLLLKEALKALCGANQWTYAVFWKISSKDPKLLVCEEHYYSPRSSNVGVSGKYENVKSEHVCDVSARSFDDSESGDKIHLLLSKMMVDDVHIPGEGLLGQAALTGEHNWICSANFRSEAHHPKVVREVYEQFSAGLQTVAVVPVLPHGVVQFGSQFQISENMGFVNNAALLLLRLGHIPGVLQPDDDSEQEPAPRMSVPMFPRLDSDSSGSFSGLFTQTSSSFSSAGEMSNGMSSCFFDTRDYHCQSQFVAEDKAALPNSDIWADRVAYKSSTAYEDPNVSLSSPLFGYNFPGMKQKIESEDFRADNTSVDDNICSYPRAGDDLFDVLGSEFRNQVLRSICGSHLGNENGTASPEICPISREEPESRISPQRQADYLLEAVVSKPHSAKQLPHPVPDDDRKIRLSGSGKEEPLGIPRYVTISGEKKSSASTGTTFIYDSWSTRGLNLKRNNDSASKPSNKRLKPGENPRPRPRDRQMIQDGVKELREIVPNGAKCSIDSLLERTIKHMLFLQSVTNHAEKLKQTMESKIIDDDGSDLRGTTYACEVGLQSTVCPIFVEDLNQPGHMLIEMLCQEQGFFLEIADIIRRLGLTILRGIIETRKDDIWARFAVESNRDITRMEVSLTLVSFIEQNSKRNTVTDAAS